MASAEAVSRRETHTVAWWLVLLEGIAAIILGIMLFAAPGSTTLVLVQIIGWYWLISGIFSIVSIFIDRHQWGWKLFAGILGVIAGFIIIQHPIWSALVVPAAFLIALAIGGIIIGVIKLIQAFSGAGWGTGILGVLSLLFGLLILAQPYTGAVVFLAILPVIAIVGGIAAIIMAFRVRRVERELDQVLAPAPATYPSTPSMVPVTGEQTETVESEHHEPDGPSASEPSTGEPPADEPSDRTM